MILVDTSLWVRHLRVTNLQLTRWLSEGRVFTSDVVIGELSLGSGIPPTVDASLRRLPRLPSSSSAEVLDFIAKHRRVLAGTGIGWADAQVLSCAAASGALLASADKPMQTAWRRLGFRGV